MFSRALSCYDKNSIWNKPTCEFFKGVCFVLTSSLLILICFPLMMIMIGLLLLVIAGIKVTIINIIGFIILRTELYDGKISFSLYNQDRNLLFENLHILLNYGTTSYEKIIFSSFGAIGCIITIIVLVSIIISIIYLFLVDVKNYGIYVYRERSFLYFCIMILSYFIIALLPLLLNFLEGIISGILMFFENTPIGRLDNYTLYNHYIMSKQSFYDKVFDLGMTAGFIIALLAIFLLIHCCLSNFRKDLSETYYDIEAGEIYKLEKKL